MEGINSFYDDLACGEDGVGETSFEAFAVSGITMLSTASITAFEGGSTLCNDFKRRVKNDASLANLIFPFSVLIGMRLISSESCDVNDWKI